MTETLEQKQQFLRSEIIDQGFNPEDFSLFMASVRNEESVDLEAWSLADIQKVVESYKQKINEAIQQNQQQEEQKAQEAAKVASAEAPQQQDQKNPQEQEATEEQAKGDNSEVNTSLNTSVGQDKSKLGGDPFADYEDVINCVKLEPNEITNRDDLVVKITNPVKVKQGLFSTTYYQYTVQTSPVNYEVVRKLSDFQFLYEKLPLFNPGVFNPVLPHFEFGLKDDSPKKLLYLQNYMNSLIENIFFRTIPIVFEFISLPQDQWNKKRDVYSKKKDVEPFSKMPNLEGVFNIKISKQDDDKGYKIRDEILLKNDAFDKVNAGFDELIATMEKLSSCYSNVSTSFFQLKNTHKSNSYLQMVFHKLTKLFDLWSKDFTKLKDFIKDEFKYFFKFMGKENNEYLKKWDEYRATRDDYKSKFERLKKPGKHTKQDFDALNSLKQYYGFQLIHVNDEYKKLLERQAKRGNIQFTKYLVNKDTILQNYANSLKLISLQEDVVSALNSQDSGELSANYNEVSAPEGTSGAPGEAQSGNGGGENQNAST